MNPETLPIVASRIVFPALCTLVLLLGSPARAQNAEAVAFFRQNCVNCHTIGGGRLTGPDLKDVTQRKDRTWLAQWLQNPKAVIDSGDPYAAKLFQDSRGVVMPTVGGMTPALAQSLLNLIEAESKLPKSQFAGSPISDRPFTAQDLDDGKALFKGLKPLRSGGPPCISCHTFRGIGGLGGGKLGPDLSLVYERLQGRKGLSAWLLSPASPTMQPIFRTRPLQPEEILPLVALFENSAKRGGVDDSPAAMNFLLLGLGGAILGLVSLDKIFQRRFRGVRRSLVHGGKPRGGR